jgi:hypothetical protein
MYCNFQASLLVEHLQFPIFVKAGRLAFVTFIKSLHLTINEFFTATQ